MKKLKRLRIEKNYSFADMAKLLSISKTYYWQIENRKRRLYYDMAFKIAKLFHVKPDDIFYDEY